MQITVVGAGVVGLATALALEEIGHDVVVVAANAGEATTSAVAGAVWFPYRVGPPDRVAVWAAQSRAWLAQLAATDRDAGVDLLVGYEITHDPPGAPPPWWAAGIEVEHVPAPVVGAPLAWKFAAPRVEPAKLLAWLRGKLRARFETRVVMELGAERGDFVIDCAGLGARELAHDDSVTPLYGQIAIAAPGGADLGVTITDDREADVFYIIPRRDEVVLGGCALAEAPAVQPDPAITARILAHAAKLGIAVGPVLRERVGFRPFRPTVRLGVDATNPRVLHNYGHGGAGFTLARGCADEVVGLLPSRGGRR